MHPKKREGSNLNLRSGTMKKLFILFVTCCVCLCAFTSAFAGCGSAVIPSFYSSETTAQNVFAAIEMSNISNNVITVSITLYDKNGSVFIDDGGEDSGDITADNVINYSDSCYNHTAEFDIEPHGTISFVAFHTAGVEKNYHYGIIEWESDSMDANALIATLRRNNHFYNSNTYSMMAVPINNGLPF